MASSEPATSLDECGRSITQRSDSRWKARCGSPIPPPTRPILGSNATTPETRKALPASSSGWTASRWICCWIPTVNGYGVASYITRSVLERWHKAHPGWRVVDGGDDLLSPKPASRMIEVPDVEIGGWSVGPVWFTERPDRNFGIKGMSRYMDRAVTGAVGGNVFEHFVMAIDYPHATAWFRCVTGCKAVATPPPAP